MAYIYKITNLVTNKIYVGKTCNSIEDRFNQHISNGRKLQGASLISKSLREYGTINHKIEVLEECFDNVLQREQHWIDVLNTLHIGYNVKNEYLDGERSYWGDEPAAIRNLKAGNVWNKGISPSIKTRTKISETIRKRRSLGLYEGSYGHKHTEETRQKLSEIAKNRPPPSPETLEKLRQRSTGRVCYYNAIEKKRIFLDNGVPAPEGYVKGKGTCWVTKGEETLCVNIWDKLAYINAGYIIGRNLCGKK